MRAFRVKIVDDNPPYYETYGRGLTQEVEKAGLFVTPRQVKYSLDRWSEYKTVVEMVDVSFAGEVSSEDFRRDF